MKKYFLGLITSLMFICGFSQNYFLAAPEGYGAATSGGGNSAPVTVSTYADLKANLKSAGAKVILVSGEITIPANGVISEIITDKSLIGLPGAKLINENQTTGAGILYLKLGSNNVIIRNLIFVGPGAYDIDGKDNLTADGATNVWVDHCEFQDGQDGNFDIKGKADNISVSWCKFTYLKPPVAGGSGGSNDHRFSNLIGSSSTDAPVDGHYSITFQNNYWGEGIKGRMPRARNAQLHILSSLFNTSVSGATAIGLGGGINNTTCYVENSNFKKVTTVYSPASADGGTVAINFVNSLKGTSNIGTVPPPNYTTTKIPVEQLESVLTDATCGAGASLQVSSTGEISSSVCTNLGSQNFTISSVKQMKTRVSENTLFLYFPTKIEENIKVEIFSSTGQLLKTQLMKEKYLTAIEVDIQPINAGTYIARAVSEKYSFSGKFLK